MKNLTTITALGLAAALLCGAARADTHAKDTNHRWRSDDGGEAAATWKAAENTPIMHPIDGGKLRLRIGVTLVPENITNQGTNLKFYLEQQKATDPDNDQWIAVAPFKDGTDDRIHWKMAASADFVNHQATTQQLLDPPGAFVAGQMAERPATDPGYPNPWYATGWVYTTKDKPYTEVEFCIEPTAFASAGGEYWFRIRAANNYGSGQEQFNFHTDSLAKVTLYDPSAGNNAPIAWSQVLPDEQVELDEDTSASITLVGTDPDGDPLSYVVTQQPQHGTLSGTAPNLTYTPDANFNGDDQLKFKVNDGTADSNEAVVDIGVKSIGDPTVLESYTPAGGSLTVEVGEQLFFSATVSDVDGYIGGVRWLKDDVEMASYGRTATLPFTSLYTFAPALGDVGVRTIKFESGNVSHSWVVTVVNSGSSNPGDLNGDNVVNIDDLTLVTGNFGKSSGDAGWDPEADANGDGVINIDDLTEVTSNFGKSY